MKKNVLLLLCCLEFSFSKSDSISDYQQSHLEKYIVSISLITLGSSAFVFKEMQQLNIQIKDDFSRKRSHFIHADNYIQYFPTIGLYGLSVIEKSQHNAWEQTKLLAFSSLFLTLMVDGLCKKMIFSPRPDHAGNNSFPSGHTATAFMGAHLLYREYGENSVWIGIGSYLLASSIGILRIYNERHWTTDVISGIGFGILSVEISYFLLFKNKQIVY